MMVSFCNVLPFPMTVEYTLKRNAHERDSHIYKIRLPIQEKIKLTNNYYHYY